MRPSRPRPPRPAARLRRRCLTAAAVLGALGLVLVLVLSAGSDGSGPRYMPSGGIAHVITSATLPAHSRLHAVRLTTFTPAALASRLAGKLSLDQQVAQLFLVSLGGPSASSVAGLGRLDWGGVVFDATNFQTDGHVPSLAADVATAARARGLVPPLLVAGPDGHPGTTAGAERAGRKLHALGFNMTLAPDVDVDTPGGALSGQLFSSDPGAVARLGLAAVEGYAAARVISAPGHFPGEGGASADPDAMTATVGGSLAQLRGRDLIPFGAIAAHAPVIAMSNAEYVAFDGVTPAGLLGSAVSLLRTGYGFQGVVMSDDLDATLQATGEDPGAVAVQALQAGDDLLYISGPASEHRQAYDAVIAAAKQNASVLAKVHAAVLRDLSLKADYGLIDK